jgi:serine acetyltransferase
MRFRKAFEQLSFLYQDLNAIVSNRKYRWFTMWLWYRGAPAVLTYRVNRCLYLVFGRSYRVIRVLLWPVFFVLRLLGPHADINYHADIGPGFRIAHPSLGAMVSARAVCGRNLLLIGGNWIAPKDRTRPDDIIIGNDVVLGANAIVLGPIRVGDNSVVGGGAVLLNDCPPGSVMVGVPARRLADEDRTQCLLEK